MLGMAGCSWALEAGSALNHPCSYLFSPDCPSYRTWLQITGIALCAPSQVLLSGTFNSKRKWNFICWELRKNPNPPKIPDKPVLCTYMLSGCNQHEQILKKAGFFHIISDISEEKKHSHRKAAFWRFSAWLSALQKCVRSTFTSRQSWLWWELSFYNPTGKSLIFFSLRKPSSRQ